MQLYGPAGRNGLVRLTPAADGWVTASTFGSYATTVFAAYTGSALGSLSKERGYRTQYNKLTMVVQAGEMYHFVVGGLYGVRGRISFQLDVTPDPVASIGIGIGDPSVFDSIRSTTTRTTPARSAWSRAHGVSATATSIDGYTTHRYAKDGDYVVQLDVRTLDGRTGSTTRVVQVRAATT